MEINPHRGTAVDEPQLHELAARAPKFNGSGDQYEVSHRLFVGRGVDDCVHIRWAQRGVGPAAASNA